MWVYELNDIYSIDDSLIKSYFTFFVCCSGIPFSCSSSACVLPHTARVIEKLAVGLPV